MNDLLLLELVIAFLLAVYIVKPLAQQLQGIDGLYALPFLAFIICILFYPAFGLRIELLPLFLYALGLCLGTMPRFVDMARHLRVSDYGEGALLRPVAGLLFLGLCISISVIYLPHKSVDRSDEIALIQERVFNGSSRERAMVFKVYQPTGDRLPATLVLAAPVFDGIASADGLCRELAKKGLSIVLFLRPAYAVPPPHIAGIPSAFAPGRALAHAWAWLSGRENSLGAWQDAVLEKEQLLSFQIALGHLLSASNEDQFASLPRDRLILAGYGSGGGAAGLLAEQGASERLLGWISIEGKVGMGAGREQALNVERGIVPKILEWLGYTAVLPYGRRILSQIPALHLLSKEALDSENRDTRYAGVLASTVASRSACATAYLGRASANDLSGRTRSHPILDPFPGQARDIGAESASIMAQTISWFITRLMPDAPQTLGSDLPVDVAIEGNQHWKARIAPAIISP